MKIQASPIANTLAATTAVIYVICALLVWVFPNASISIAQSWFHGIEISQVSSLNITLASFLTGLASSVVFSWLVGYLFARIYQQFNK